MSKKILSVLSHTEYGNLEDSDIGLFASAFAPVAGSHMTVLLSEDAAWLTGQIVVIDGGLTLTGGV